MPTPESGQQTRRGGRRIPCAVIVGLIIVCAAVLAFLTLRGGGARSHFYTSAATEEPTRSYTPYTGTPNLGYWGVQPWAVAALSPAPLCG